MEINLLSVLLTKRTTFFNIKRPELWQDGVVVQILTIVRD